MYQREVVHTAWLSVGVVHMNIIRPVCVVAHDDSISTSVLVGPLHCVSVPVCPEHSVLKQGHSEGVRKRARYGPMSVLSVHVSVTVREQSGMPQRRKLLVQTEVWLQAKYNAYAQAVAQQTHTDLFSFPFFCKMRLWNVDNENICLLKQHFICEQQQIVFKNNNFNWSK